MKRVRTLKPRKLRNVIIAAVALAGAAIGQRLPDRQLGEYDVKAVFLLNFVKFVEWPAIDAGEGDTFSICILGEDPFGNSLDRIVQGESVDGKRVVIERVRRWQRPCRVLFVSSSEVELSRILASVGPGTLTVGEADNFLHAGGMIDFVIENRRIRFDINQKAARAASLSISSRMLAVARQVLP